MRESDIRPTKFYLEFLKLAQQDALDYFLKSARVSVSCPACGTAESEHAFIKSGFSYALCRSCGTLYVTPRPPQQDFARFYRESPSAQYFSNVFFPPVMEARRERIFVPRVARISEQCRAAGIKPSVVIDIGGGNGIFLEEWRKAHPETTVPRFVRTLLRRGEKALLDLQDFLVRHQLSSHAAIWARRPAVVQA